MVEDQLWPDKHRPRDVSDLAVHTKKVRVFFFFPPFFQVVAYCMYFIFYVVYAYVIDRSYIRSFFPRCVHLYLPHDRHLFFLILGRA